MLAGRDIMCHLLRLIERPTFFCCVFTHLGSVSVGLNILCWEDTIEAGGGVLLITGVYYYVEHIVCCIHVCRVLPTLVGSGRV